MSLRIEDAETMESMSQKLKNLKLINKDKNIPDNNVEKGIRTTNLFLITYLYIDKK